MEEGLFRLGVKKRRRNLDEAMVQLTRYAAALEHPPLLVVCDTIRFRILTTWTNLETKKYSFELEDLADPDKFNILRSVFHNPDALKPTRTRAMITAEAAKSSRAFPTRCNSAIPTARRWRISSIGSSSAFSPTAWSCCPRGC